MRQIAVKLASLKFPKMSNSTTDLSSRLARNLILNRPYPKKSTSIKSTIKSLPGIFK